MGCLQSTLHAFRIRMKNNSTSVIDVGDMHLVALSTLGEGAYSIVLKCKDPFTDTTYAVKRMTLGDDDKVVSAEKEVEILRSACPHPNIVNLYASSCPAGKATDRVRVMYIATEFCEGALIFQMMEHRAFNRFLSLEGIVFRVLNDTVAALAHLHGKSPPITHRDLKPENILLKEGVYKLCDFGSATTEVYRDLPTSMITSLMDDFSRLFTLQYRAPETLDLWKKKTVGPKVDVWALGVLTFYMCFLELPFEEQPLQILGGRYVIPPYTTNCNEKLETFIRKLLVVDPDERPDIWEVSSLLHDIYPSHAIIRKD
eukprot:PhF_6_TR19828/c0_g1_i1/m.28909/K08853/AAK; AP2-associated kinase